MASEPFVPTHTIPGTGTRAWETPDGSGPAAARLDPGLEVQVVQRKDDWAKILCSNGWAAWVDGRRLVELTPPSNAPAPTPAAATEAPVTGPPSAEPATGPPTVAAPTTTTTTTAEAPAAAAATTATMTMTPEPVEPVEAETTAGLEIRGLSIVSLVGAVAIAGGSFLDWWKLGPLGTSAWDIPVKYLLTGKAAGDGFKVGPILVLLALGVAVTLVIGRRLPDLVLVTLAAFAIGIALCALVRGMANDPTVYPEVGLLVTMAGGALVAVDGFGFLRRSR